MSTIIAGQCWPLQGLSVTQKMVLISMADQANDDGVCWPAVGTIARRCCMSERAVRSAMDHLEAVGLLARERRFNSSSNYTVTPDKYDETKAPGKGKRKAAKAIAAPAPGTGDAPRAGGAPDAPGDAPDAGGPARGAGLDLHGAPPNRHITIIEPSEEPSSPAGLAAPPAVDASADDPETKLQLACRMTWAAYSTAYRVRHGVAPVRNAKVNATVRQLVQRLGNAEAHLVAGWFVGVNERFVVQGMHDLGLLLAKAEAYRTQWATGRTMTQTRAQQSDRAQSNYDAADEVIALLNAKRTANAR